MTRTFEMQIWWINTLALGPNFESVLYTFRMIFANHLPHLTFPSRRRRLVSLVARSPSARSLASSIGNGGGGSLGLMHLLCSPLGRDVVVVVVADRHLRSLARSSFSNVWF